MNPTDVVRSYLDRVNAHNVDGALALLGPDFELEFEGSDVRMDRDAARRSLEWDAGVNGRLLWSIVADDEATVTVEGAESNDFLELLGIEALGFHSCFHVDASDLIARQVHRAEWPEPPLDEALAPVVAWARQYEPAEIAEIYAGDRITYTRHMAIRWVALLRRWREATGLVP